MLQKFHVYQLLIIHVQIAVHNMHMLEVLYGVTQIQGQRPQHILLPSQSESVEQPILMPNEPFGGGHPSLSGK